MAAITYLPRQPYVRPIKSDEGNTLAFLACTAALGTLAYYAPRTFYATVPAMISLSVWGFSHVVQKSKLGDGTEIRTLAIRICTVMLSAGLALGWRGLSTFWSAVKAARQFEFLRTGGYSMGGATLILSAVVLIAFGSRIDTLIKTKNWVEMDDFLGFPIEIRNKIEKIELFFMAFVPDASTKGHPHKFAQFKTPEAKFEILQNYLPKVGSTDKTEWMYAIHFFQGQSFWNQETLMPHLVRICRNINPGLVNGLPDDIKERVIQALATYSLQLTNSLELFMNLPSLPEVGTKDWQIFVSAVNRIPKIAPGQRYVYLNKLSDMAKASPPDQVEQLLPQFIKEAIRT